MHVFWCFYDLCLQTNFGLQCFCGWEYECSQKSMVVSMIIEKKTKMTLCMLMKLPFKGMDSFN